MNAYAQDDPFAPLGAGEVRRGTSRAEQPDDWQPMPVPDDAPEAPTQHPKLGAWSHRWPYRNADGSLCGYFCRFDDTERQGTSTTSVGTTPRARGLALEGLGWR